MPKNKTKKSIPGMQTKWDLSVFYTSASDKKIERDIQKVEKAVTAFARKYKEKKTWCTNPKMLKEAIDAYEKCVRMPETSRPMVYFFYRRELDARDSEAEKKINHISSRLTNIMNAMLFFEIAIGRISKKNQARLLKHPLLSEYHYFLERIFLEAEHTLSEPEERVMNLKSLPAHSLWISGTEKILNKRTVRVSGKDMPLPEALTATARMPKIQRRKTWSRITDELYALGEIAENELNAVVLDKKISDELRGYAKPYSATIEGDQNTEKTIEALTDAVSTEGFAISRDFYKLKAQMLGEKQIQYVDRVASIGREQKIPFSDAVERLRSVFYGLKDEYGEILDTMLANGQIDVFPKAGKSGGAFCSSTVGLPTFVFLNHVDNLRSFTTFAHEMGHAVHAERSKKQRPLYQDHTTATAETASTLFENLVFEALLETLSDTEKKVALHNKLDEDIASIMRQIAFFNYEKELHTIIRTEGGMTREEMAKLLQKHLQKQLGPAVNVTEADGYSFVYVSHFRMFFYVYTYAYGNLISNLLAQRWKKDPAYIESIDAFLVSGGNRSPEEIFKSIGINTADPAFFTQGLQQIKGNLQELTRLTKA